MAPDDLTDVEGYVGRYLTFGKKTVESLLFMTETVYEAKAEFSKDHRFVVFCDRVGIDPGGATCNKMTTIGKATPVLLPYAYKLPRNWTTLYKIAKLPEPERVTVLESERLNPETTAKELDEIVEASERWKGVAEAGSAVASGLDAIANTSPEFDVKHFLTGARAAYEMIVTAFAEGDRRTLKNLLSREVYDGFESAISERESRSETVESRFVSIDNAEITAAELRGRSSQVTVRFQSKMVSVTRDKNGNVIDGNADKVTDVTDVWTFARDISSRDPNWKLVATEAEAAVG